MKLFVTVALVAAVAFASSSHWAHPSRHEQLDQLTHFKADRQYRFLYNGQIATGLPQSAEHHSATRVQAEVKLYLEKDNKHANIQINQIRMASLNKELVEPRDVQPFGLYEEQTIEREQLDLLRQPLRFRYENGMVSDLEFTKEERTWSANVKRAIVNMLQINLHKDGRTDRAETMRLMSEDRMETEGVADFFVAQETTLEGNCETAYTFVPKTEKMFTLTKTINFEKCQERSDIRYGFRFGERCNSCEKKFSADERNTESSTVFNYNITGTPEQFLIREVEVRSQYTLAPFNEQTERMTTYVAGRLELLGEEKKSVHMEKNLKEKESLIYSAAWDARKELFQMEGEMAFNEQTPYTHIKDKHTIVEKLVKELVKMIKDENKNINEEAPRLLARIVKVVRMCNAEEIEKIHSDVYDKIEETEARELLAETMGLAGTKHSIDHLVEKITKKQVSPLKAAWLLKSLVNTRVVSEQQIESLVRLCESDLARKHGELRQSCWLTTGAMINSLCAPSEDRLALTYEQPERRVCPRALKQKFVKMIWSKVYERAENTYEKVLALKTLANAAIDISIVEIEQLIRNPREDRVVRIAAIESLRLLRTQMPRKIQNILLPIYKNIRIESDVRAQAFHMLMQTMPERSVLSQLLGKLEVEPSRQLAVFVYEQMQQLANSTNPCEQQIASDATVVLREMREPIRRRLSFESKFVRLQAFSRLYNLGSTLNLAALYSTDSFLPKELTASLESVFAGSWTRQHLQIGAWQQNLDQLVVRILKELENKNIDEIVVRGKRATTESSFRPAELLRSLISKLNIRGRNAEKQQPQGMIYARFRDFDYAMLPIDEEHIPELVKRIVKNNRIELVELERVLAQGLRMDWTMATFGYETSRKIATSAGFPLLVSAKLPTVATINGLVKLEIEPKNGNKITGLKVRVEAKPRLAATHVTKMEIWTPIVNHGFKLLHSVEFNTPVDATVEFNGQEKPSVKLVVKAPEQRKRLVRLHTRPVAYTRVWPARPVKSYIEPVEKTVYGEHIERLVRPVELTWGERATGLRFKLRGHAHKQLFTQTPRNVLPVLVGENLVELTVEPTEQAPREFMLRVEASTFERVNSMELPQFERFFEHETEKKMMLNKKDNKKVSSSSSSESNEYEEYMSEGKFFSVESVEEQSGEKSVEEIDEPTRRAAFQRYAKSLKTQSAYKQRVWLKLETIGSSTDRFIESELVAVCDERMQHCRINAKAVRTPLLETETGKWQATAKIETLFPEFVQTWKQLREQQHREFAAQANIEWGNELQYNAVLSLQAEQNKEQKQWLIRAEKEEQRRDIDQLISFERLRDAAQLNQFKLVVKHNTSPAVRTISARLFQAIKTYNLWNMKTVYPVERMAEDRFTVRMTVEPITRRYVNLTIETPEELIHIQDMLAPIRIAPLNIRHNMDLPVRSTQQLIERVVARHNAECVVKSNKINTFDEVIYKAPITTCYSVLAKDCSNEREQPRFAVLLKKINKNSEQKKLRVIDEERLIEVESDEDEKLVIRINGKTEKKVEKLEKQRIQLINEFVKIELDDVVVLFDGYTAKIRMSARLQNAQCGLCGHYDGQSNDEFRRADNQLTDNLREFHNSFIDRENECKFEENKKQLEESEEFELYSREHPVYNSEEKSNESIESSEESEEIEQINKKTRKQYREQEQREDYDIDYTVTPAVPREPVKRTHVIEYNHRICFSKEAVKECPRRSMPLKTVEKKVKFACIERSQPEALKFTRLARQQVINMKPYADSFVETVQEPIMCEVY